MAGKVDELLQQMSKDVNGFIACSVVGSDGISIAQESQGNVDLDTAAAQLSIFLRLATSASQKVDMGTLEDLVLQTKKAFVMTVFIAGGTDYYLTTIVDRQSGSLGNMRMMSKVYADRISKVIPR